MWSGGGLERLRGPVRARLRAVLEGDCPPLEPAVRTVLEQRLDSAVQDLLELVRRGESPGPGPGPGSGPGPRPGPDPRPASVETVKEEQPPVKQESDASDWNIVCVKVEQDEQEIPVRTVPELKQDEGLDVLLENCQYCPHCGSTLGARDTPPSPPARVQPQCSVCGQSSGRDVLLLEHNYTQDPQSLQRELQQGTAAFRCSACGQDFSQVGALLEHMSQHLALSGTDTGHRFDSGDGWSFEDEAFDGAPPETTCSVCGFTSNDTERLQQHLHTHLR